MMWGEHFMLVTLERSLQIVLSKTMRIAETKYRI